MSDYLDAVCFGVCGLGAPTAEPGTPGAGLIQAIQSRVWFPLRWKGGSPGRAKR